MPSESSECKKSNDEPESSIKISLQGIIWFCIAGIILMLMIKLKELMTKIELFENAFSRLRPINCDTDNDDEAEMSS